MAPRQRPAQRAQVKQMLKHGERRLISGSFRSRIDSQSLDLAQSGI
jgi:hypothetical protein